MVIEQNVLIDPCGVAQRGTLIDAWNEALACDSVSAFGGIVAVNRELDGETARAICEIFTEVVIAPSVSDEAREAFAKKKTLRLLTVGDLPERLKNERNVFGGDADTVIGDADGDGVVAIGFGA